MIITAATFDNTYNFLLPTTGFMWPKNATVDDFPSCCGAGTGIQETLVPDTFYGLNVSPACWIHDQMFALAGPTWTEFHQSNDVFLHNLKQIIKASTNSVFLKHLRYIRAFEYYAAVTLPGSIAFWGLKRLQGLISDEGL